MFGVLGRDAQLPARSDSTASGAPFHDDPIPFAPEAR